MDSLKNLCVLNVLDGLREGLSQFSGPSRAALIYAEKPDDALCVCDPQDLLQGHEPKLEDLYLTSDAWRTKAPDTRNFELFGQIFPEKNLELAGLISYGGRTRSIFYQMWFTEHHPDMCSIGPTERWLEHAIFLLSHDFAFKEAFYTGTSRYVLREYVTHAVRDHLQDGLTRLLGWDAPIWIYPILEAVLGISKTPEEGLWPRGMLTFVEPAAIPHLDFLVRFPPSHRPTLKNIKHVRKLLLAVEEHDRRLVSDGKEILGAIAAEVPDYRITADFRGRHGFLRLAGEPVCSFSDGSFHSWNYKANLVELEEALLETDLDPALRHDLFKTVRSIVDSAGQRKYGCTLILDLDYQPVKISGQQLERSIDLRENRFLRFAKSVARVDGAIHIGADCRLLGFACLLDGRAVPSEDRSRGARFNSALRFTAEHPDLIVVVVSADRPVSVIQGGVELSARCDWKPFTTHNEPLPALAEWLKRTV